MNRFTYFLSLTLISMSFLAAAQTAENETPGKVVIEVGSFHAPDANSYDFNYDRPGSWAKASIIQYEQERASWTEQEIVQFEKAYPHVQVETIDLFQKSTPITEPTPMPEDAEQYRATLAKDVVGFSSFAENKKYYLAEKGLIVPLDKHLRDPDFDKDSIYKNLWTPATFWGEVWGVPWSCDTYVMLINQELFKDAGIEKTPTTWDEMLALGKKKLKTVGGRERWGIGVVGDRTFRDLAVSYALQSGSKFFENQQFSLSDPDLVKAFTWSQEFRQYAKEIHWTELDQFRFGITDRAILADNLKKYAVIVLPTSHAAVILRRIHQAPRLYGSPPQKLDYRIEPLPTIDGNAQQAPQEIHYLAIRKSTPEREKASWEFIKWVMRPNSSINLGTNDRTPGLIYMPGYPCHKNFLKRNDLQRHKDKTVANIDAFWVAQQHVIPLFPGNLKGGHYALKYIGETFSQDMSSGVSPEDSLARMEATANAMLSHVTQPAPSQSALFQ